MATIGRSRAVAVIGRLQLDRARSRGGSGSCVHLVMLIGFRNRLVVLVNWAWNYLTYDRGLRAIVGDASRRARRAPAGATPPAAERRAARAALAGPRRTRPQVAGGGFEPPTSRL